MGKLTTEDRFWKLAVAIVSGTTSFAGEVIRDIEDDDGPSDRSPSGFHDCASCGKMFEATGNVGPEPLCQECVKTLRDKLDGEPEGEGQGYRYFMMGDYEPSLYRVGGPRLNEAWRNGEWCRPWVGSPASDDASWWERKASESVVSITELTKSEAVERFGREILYSPEPEWRERVRRAEGIADGKEWREYRVCPLCDHEFEVDADEEPDDGQTEHQRALERLDLKPGDRVRVERKVDDYHGGWGAVWNDKMEAAVGKVGEVITTHSPHGVRVEVDGVRGSCIEGRGWWYPAHVLTLVSRASDEPPKPTTLAEVEPYVLCKTLIGDGPRESVVPKWRTDEGNVYGCREDGGTPQHLVGADPAEFVVARLLGPVRVNVEVADAE